VLKLVLVLVLLFLVLLVLVLVLLVLLVLVLLLEAKDTRLRIESSIDGCWFRICKFLSLIPRGPPS
jgi:hypothetical protein